MSELIREQSKGVNTYASRKKRVIRDFEHEEIQNSIFHLERFLEKLLEQNKNIVDDSQCLQTIYYHIGVIKEAAKTNG